jgi:hypothetical protein
MHHSKHLLKQRTNFSAKAWKKEKILSDQIEAFQSLLKMIASPALKFSDFVTKKCISNGNPMHT